MEKEILTTYEIASRCHVDIKTVINWTNDGSLKAYKTKGGHRRIKRADLVEFLSKHNMPISLKKRILVVDDDESIRIALRESFESKGFIVYLADNGFTAGTIFEAKRPDVIILDFVMPGIDGINACKYIRKMEDLKHTKIIFLTGYPSKDNFKEAKKAGADICLAKPVDNEVLFKEVEEILGVFADG
ncbi:MAG: response regulator [PVC group bacterium]|nr:response regulator [PVC group bacterium]